MAQTRNPRKPDRKRRLADADAEGEIRERLKELLKRHSQADIARRVGVPAPYVNRYLGGTAIPATFCRALVKELGVNPAWLLAGEGEPFVADMMEGAGNLAGDLLEVVNALNVVGQMRIGSLGGKHHLRVLRELDDAMKRYEDLREKLNRHSTPLLRSTLEDLRAALNKRNLDLAGSLGRTAEQLARFSDDVGLALELSLLQGRQGLAELDMSRSLEQTRRAVVLALREGGTLTEKQFEAVVESIATLIPLGRHFEVQRIARAAFALAPKELLDSEAAHRLTALMASIRILSGELHEGLRELTHIRGLLQEGTLAREVDSLIAKALWLSGAINTAAAIAHGGDSTEKAVWIVGYASLHEDESGLPLALAYLDKFKLPEDLVHRTYARLTLRALQGGDPALGEDIDRFAAQKRVSLLPGNPYRIVDAMLYRLAGNRDKALRSFHEACDEVRKFGEAAGGSGSAPVGIMWQACHCRNALALGDEEQRARAGEFFREHIRRGYLRFAEIA